MHSYKHLTSLILFGFLGCTAEASSGTFDSQAPVVYGPTTSSVAVGQPLIITGENFVAPEFGWVDITFTGEFVPADGGPRDTVELTVPLQAEAPVNGTEVSTTVRWERFGVYRVPFGDGTDVGHFEGFISSRNRYWDGSSDPSDPDLWPLTRLEIEPSIVVLDMRGMGQTWVADCLDPATTLVSTVPYGMRVLAAGFEPASFEFHIGEGLLVDGRPTTTVTRIDGETEGTQSAVLMQFAPVPEYIKGFATSVNVYATAADGTTYSLEYPITVRRPIDAYFTGPFEVAQIYKPTVVSGCTPGGPSSVQTAYAESRSETRTRTRSIQNSQNWQEAYGESHTGTRSRAVSEGGSETATESVTMSDATTMGGRTVTTDTFSNTTSRTRISSFDFTTTENGSYAVSASTENSHQWNVNASANTEVNIIPQVWSVGGEVGGGYTDGYSETNGTVGTTGFANTSRRGTQAGTSSSTTRAQSRANERHWSRTQTYSEMNSFSQARTWNTTDSFSEAQTESETYSYAVGEILGESESISTTEAESLQTTAWVWAGLFGTWYRQTTRLQRTAVLVAFDLCGNGTEVGTATLQDWTWAPDLAIGDSCPPETNFPPAECRIEPCDI